MKVIKNILGDTFFKTLKGFKVPLKLYLVESMNGVNEVALVGGLEVIDRIKLEYAKDYLAGLKGNLDGLTRVGYRDLPPFIYEEGIVYNGLKLENLLKYKSKKQLSKAEFMEFGDSAEDSALSLLENKIVYIHEKTPSTNSLSLAKQFKLRHRHVVEDLFKIAESYPSTLTGIEFKPYSYKTKVATNYSTYLEVSEDVYYRFLEKMGTPKSIEMVVLRDAKRREYFQGFQRLREASYIVGYNETELDKLINTRTEKTKILLTSLNSLVIFFNDNVGDRKKVNPVTVMRVVFNAINAHVEIHAIKNRNIKDRNEKNVDTQETLKTLESNVTSTINMVLRTGTFNKKCFKEVMVDILVSSLDIKEDTLDTYLDSYGVGNLLESLK